MGARGKVFIKQGEEGFLGCQTRQVRRAYFICGWSVRSARLLRLTLVRQIGKHACGQ